MDHYSKVFKNVDSIMDETKQMKEVTNKLIQEILS